MPGSLSPYLLSGEAARKLRPANDRGGIFVGMLPFTRAPFLAALAGLVLLLPLFLVDTGFSLYSASRTALATQTGTPVLQLPGTDIVIPPSLQRVASLQEDGVRLRLQRIGGFLVPRAAARSLADENALDLHLGDLRSRPGLASILQGLQALHRPVRDRDEDVGSLSAYRLASGPLTGADMLYLAPPDAGRGMPRFMALCRDGGRKSPTRNPKEECTAYLATGLLFLELGFSRLALADWQQMREAALGFSNGLLQRQDTGERKG